MNTPEALVTCIGLICQAAILIALFYCATR